MDSRMGVGKCSSTHHVSIVPILHPECKAREAWNQPFVYLFMVPYRLCHWHDDSEQWTGKAVVTFVEVPSKNLPGGAYENKQNLQSEYSMTRRIQTRQLLNTSQKCHRWSQLIHLWKLQCVEPIHPLLFRAVICRYKLNLTFQYSVLVPHFGSWHFILCCD
jgi:hypothetical protein